MSADADTNVRRLYHANVVGAVANRERDGLLVHLDELHDERLLKGTHAAAYHARTPRRGLQEALLQLRLERKVERVAVDHKRLLDAGGRGCARGDRLFNLLRALVDRPCVDDAEVHVLSQQPRGKANVDRRLLLVPRQHPDLDRGARERRDRVGHADLQLVFNGGRAEQHEVLLNQFGDFVELFLAVVECDGRRVVLVAPLAKLALRQFAEGEAQRTKAVRRKLLEVKRRRVAHVLHGPRPRKPLVDHRVRALAVQPELAVRTPQNDRHALAVAVKLEDGEQLVRLVRSHDVNRHRRWRTRHEREPKVARGLDEGGLVRALRLV
eukprot:Opistho-1_new@21063